MTNPKHPLVLLILCAASFFAAGCVATAEEIRDRLGEQGVACLKTAPTVLRLVTHRDVDAADIDFAIDAARKVLAQP